MISKIPGGVCAAQGFKAAGVRCGIRKNHDKKDLALIVSDKKAACAAVYTQNLVKGAPLLVTKAHIADGYAQAVICNSGNANTCNANGIEIAEQTCDLLADATGLNAQDIVIASTGVIGQPLDITPIKNGIPALTQSLNADGIDAAEAIMTTDTKAKSTAVRFTLSGVECHLGGIAKGSGMINPNMATMLGFITTDVAISPTLLQKALSADVKTSFNMLCIDGDTSTNDMVTVLANGMAGNTEIVEENNDYVEFCAALQQVTVSLCQMMAADGEGATKMLECQVSGGVSVLAAQTAAKAVISSSLLKAAMFGADANWGRVLCAIGYSGADVDVNLIDVDFCSEAGNISVCKAGAGVEFSEERAKQVLSRDAIYIKINLHQGTHSASAWGCDLTYDYVKINGDYRT